MANFAYIYSLWSFEIFMFVSFLQFFAPLRPSNVKIIYNNKGLHSGTADAYFDAEEDAEEAMKKDREQMGSRYIELFFDGKSKNGGFRRL